jgi:hypothetical protein
MPDQPRDVIADRPRWAAGLLGYLLVRHWHPAVDPPDLLAGLGCILVGRPVD